jgi:hypothetical protein
LMKSSGFSITSVLPWIITLLASGLTVLTVVGQLKQPATTGAVRRSAEAVCPF